MCGLLTNGKLRQANLKMLFERAKQYEKASFKGLYNFINFIDKLKTNSGDLSAAKVIGENDNVIRIMSIHKSKGLEFPVVFLSLTGKKFNFRDLNESILLHQELGLGIKYKDNEKQIEYPTLTKEAIKIKSKKEVISEEMRVLYVALTRAKEKLIITGTIKELESNIKEKEEYIEINSKEEKTKPSFIAKMNSYLDWILFVYLKKKEQIKDVLELNIYSSKEILETKNNKNDVNNLINIFNNEKKIENIEEIKQKLEWKYKYQNASQIPTKTSITKLKEQSMIENIEEIDKSKQTELNMKVPSFAKENNKITSAQRGTIIHLCMQLLENNKNYTEKEIKQWIEELVEKELITKQESKEIPTKVILEYMKSDIYNELKTAKEIHKEEPFYLHIPAKTIYEDNNLDEKIVAQGIIDLYYINSKNELILVDYKTDYIEKGQEEKLIQRYKKQLELYKEALENSLERKVDKVLIYSTWIGEVDCHNL